MKSDGKFLLASAAMILVMGCSAYQLEPPTMNHPANPEAIAAPQRPLSKTLAYAAADKPPLPSLAATEPGGHEAHHPTTPSKPQTAVGEGKVIATVPNGNQLVVEHGEIKGFMEAMTMGYRIDPPSLLEGLKSGDKVRFTIDVEKKIIVKIEKLDK